MNIGIVDKEKNLDSIKNPIFLNDDMEKDGFANRIRV